VRVIKAGPGEVVGGPFFHPGGGILVANADRFPTIGIDMSGNQLLKLFAEEANPFETLICRQVEKLKGQYLSLGDVVRLDFESGRELDRRTIHLRHPFEGSGYYGRGATLSPDGNRFAMALHTSVEAWTFDGDAGD